MARAARQAVEPVDRHGVNANIGSLSLFDQGLHALVAAGCLDIELFDGVRCITKAGDHRMKASQDLMRRHDFPCRVGWILTLPANDGLGLSFWVPRCWRHSSEEHTSELQSLMRNSYA